jgi:hypothetical protein
MIRWPPFSPDLNLIEMVWNWMKNYLQANFPEYMTLLELRIALREAWEAIPPNFLQDLLKSMPERCCAVIEAGGGHTKF